MNLSLLSILLIILTTYLPILSSSSLPSSQSQSHSPKHSFHARNNKDQQHISSLSYSPSPSLPDQSPLFLYGNSSFHSVRSFSMRSNMLNSKWLSNTQESSGNAMKFLNTFPRMKPNGAHTSNVLQRLGGPVNKTADPDASDDPISEYISGMSFMIGIPVLFAFLSLICWLGFCISRCWCNCCGRHATKLYTDKQINFNRVASCLLIIILGLCCAFGWSGNVQVSTGIDSVWIAADDIAAYGYEYMGILSTAWQIGDDAMRLGVQFNQTLAVLPNDTGLVTYSDCVIDGYSVTLTQQQFTTASSNSYPNLQNTASDVYPLRTTLSQLSTVKTNLAPNLPTIVANQLNSLNRSFPLLPDSVNTKQDISDLNTAIVNYNQTINSAFSTKANTYASAATPLRAAIPAILSAYPVLETGIGNLPNLTDLSIRVRDGTSNAAILTTRLQQLNTTLSQFPAMTAFTNNMNSLSTGITSLNSNLPALQVSAQNFQTMSNNFLNLARLQSELLAIQSYQTSNTNNFSVLIGNAGTLNTQFQAIPSFSTVYAGITSSQSALNRVSSTDLTGLQTTITNLNDSLADLACLETVIETLYTINTTIVILPDNILALLYNISLGLSLLPSLQTNLTLAHASITTAANTLPTNAHPDFSSMLTLIQNIETKLNNIPNYATFGTLVTQLSNLNNTLYNISSSSYLSSLTTLITSISNININGFVEQIIVLQQELALLPSLTVYVNSIQSFNASRTVLPGMISAAIPSDLHNAQLANEIDNLNNAVTGRPTTASLTTPLTSVNTTLFNITAPTVLTAAITSQSSTISTFPSVTTLNSTYYSYVAAQNQQSYMLSLLTSNSLPPVTTSFNSYSSMAQPVGWC